MKTKSDRRKSRRQRVLKTGKILFGGGLCILDCVVRDHSTGGARLRIESPEFVPKRFTLRIPKDGFEAEAVVCNRNDNEIGVRLSA